MRLIDADKLKKAFCSHCDGDEPCTEPCIDIGLIETAPTIDAVEVVHCKDCKHFGEYCDEYKEETQNDGMCELDIKDSVTFDFFCADGERRDVNGI